MTLSKCVALLAAAAVTLTGCANLTKSPAQGLTFKPPAGWTASPGIFGVTQIWVSPKTAAGTQELLLLKLPVVATSRDIIDQGQFQNAHIQVRRHVTICGNASATYVQFNATARSQHQDVEGETVMTARNGKTLVAMYIRPLGAKADPQVAASIYQLCPAKS